MSSFSKNNTNDNQDAADDLAASLEQLSVSNNNNKNTVSDALIDCIQKAQSILVVAGAGVSVAAGIPDFRTPGTGLYDNLDKFHLPHAEAVFELDFYRQSPTPFVQLASEIWPRSGKFVPTLTHCFLRLLETKQKLLRIYSQNIDGLESLSNISEHKLVECHGHFRTSRCIDCKKQTPNHDEVVQCITVKQQVPVCSYCQGYVKPDIVFFGEQLPDRFHQMLRPDLGKADVCMVLGTSLQVPPVAYIPEMVQCDNRILLNRENVLSKDKSYTDHVHLGDVDASVLNIAERLGWKEELEQIHSDLSKTLDGADKDEPAVTTKGNAETKTESK